MDNQTNLYQSIWVESYYLDELIQKYPDQVSDEDKKFEEKNEDKDNIYIVIKSSDSFLRNKININELIM